MNDYAQFDIGDLPWLASAWSQYLKSFGEDRLGHAYLLQAPAGFGKATLAAAMQAQALCADPGADGPCGACRSCELLKSGAHPDQRTLTLEPRDDGKMRQEIVVEQVRRLMASMQMTTTVSERMAALVIPAEAMNKSAANALLKTLEEPAGSALLVLVSHDPRRLPATVVSRCQRLRLALPDRSELVDWLMERHAATRDDAETALLACHGSPLNALALLQGDGLDMVRALRRGLAALLNGQASVPEVVAVLAEMPEAEVWGWLSDACAQWLRDQAIGRTPKWAMSTGPAVTEALFGLQASADRNRRLVSTTVRQDLLLQEWLIEWKALARGRSQAIGNG